jgi:hypothetical protein
MSLTSFIKNPDINAKLNDTIKHVSFQKKPDEPTPTGRNDLVGIAVDYFIHSCSQKNSVQYYAPEIILLALSSYNFDHQSKKMLK